MKDDRKLIEDLKKCVLCGGCKAPCPTYGQDRVEPMSARGRMLLALALVKGELGPSPLLNERIFSCLLCGKCEAVCPAGVSITEAVYGARGILASQDLKRKRLRMAAGFALRRPSLSFRVAGLLKPAMPLLRKKGLLPFDLRLPSSPFRKGTRVYKPRSARGRVALFTGCAVNYIYPHLGEAATSVLLRAGYEVVLQGGEVCCGAPLRALGMEEEAKRFAEKNLDAFSKLNAEAVLSLCPTCTLSLKSQYLSLVGRGLDLAEDITVFLAGRVEVPAAPSSGTVYYHNPCHLAYGLSSREAPRTILRGLGHRIVEPPEQVCCGFSASFTHPGLSEGLLADAGRAMARADSVVTACPGCMAQLSRRHGRVLHIIESLDLAMDLAEEKSAGTAA